MDLDALRTSHAIAVDVKHPSEIGQLFDSISYSKGARYTLDYNNNNNSTIHNIT
jgi:aminopeptidase N